MNSVSPIAKYKLVFLGDVFVGKTSLIQRFMNESFDVNYQATVGIDFLSKTMYLGDRTIRLQLWDTAGQERFRSLIPNYIRDSAVAVIVYDLTNTQSFENIQKWIDDVKNERGDEALLVLVGNKSDKADERAVSEDDAQSKAKQLNLPYIETSAKSGENVQQLFKMISNLLPKEISAEVLQQPKQFIDLREPKREPAQESNCKC